MSKIRDTINSLTDEFNKKSQESIQGFNEKVENFIAEKEEKSNLLIDELHENKKLFEAFLEEVGEIKEDIAQKSENTQKHIKEDYESKIKEITSKKEELDSVIKKLKSEIETLMPKATSAVLSNAFSVRAEKFEKPKQIAAIGFIVSIVAIIGIELWIPKSGENSIFWAEYLKRLLFIGPAIWLGWVCIKQYINSTRLQEDYEFKAATSKAFVGYKDHMEYMSKIESDSEGTESNVMQYLANRTVDILSQEPGRLLGKPHDDTSPLAASQGSLKKIIEETIKSIAKNKETQE